MTRVVDGLFVPSTEGPVMTQSARFTEAALTFRLNFSKRLIVYQQLTSCLRERRQKASILDEHVCRSQVNISLLCWIWREASWLWSTITTSRAENNSRVNADVLACQTKWQHTYVSYALINVILALLAQARYSPRGGCSSTCQYWLNMEQRVGTVGRSDRTGVLLSQA